MVIPAIKTDEFIASKEYSYDNIIQYSITRPSEITTNCSRVVFYTTPKKGSDTLSVTSFDSKQMTCAIYSEEDPYGMVYTYGCICPQGFDVEVMPYNSNKVAFRHSIAYRSKKTYDEAILSSGFPYISSEKITAKMKNIKASSQFYKIRVRSYIMIDGTKVAGPWSEQKQSAPALKITKIKKTKSGLDVTLGKVKGASSYEIWVNGRHVERTKKNIVHIDAKYLFVKSKNSIFGYAIRQVGSKKNYSAKSTVKMVSF